MSLTERELIIIIHWGKNMPSATIRFMGGSSPFIALYVSQNAGNYRQPIKSTDWTSLCSVYLCPITFR
ncbi:hypothetical protein XELAEV_18030091mg [Xenopus laevis]|uniref:Uncharacterized protein n=1 Tax=Xenopus laevis TaxID=8355 RepID=A0A974CT23_XENLA|nr:hypothetical protein XELAEV_18030091mg [Xenopus laevis]